MTKLVRTPLEEIFGGTNDSFFFLGADEEAPGASARGTFDVKPGGVRPLDPDLASGKGGIPGPPDKGGSDGGTPTAGGTGVLSSYTSDDPTIPNSSEFNVEITFKGSWTEALQQAFIKMADYLGDLILADIPDVRYRGNTIDDIHIEAKLTDIDGAGGVLGQAGPTAVRTGSWLPATAVMEFDSADAAFFDSLGKFDDIVLHEMLHCIGFGTMWSYMGLTSGSVAGGDLVFTGANAMAAYAAAFNTSGGVPIETDFGSGTAGGHWDELIFGTELMTGIIGDYYGGNSLAKNYVSEITVAALEDMGYDTVWDDITSGTDATGPMPPDPINDALIV